jgi:rhodanese-related sulfurtransferase
MTIEEITPIAGRELIEGGAFLLDVREADEWTAGRSDRAHWIPLGSLAERVGEVPSDRRIVCICRSGARSLRAAEFLATGGFDAVNLAGGMRAWAETGLDVIGDDGGPGTVI